MFYSSKGPAVAGFLVILFFLGLVKAPAAFGQTYAPSSLNETQLVVPEIYSGLQSVPVKLSYDATQSQYTVIAINEAFSLSWSGDYSEVSLYLLPDMNGNGSPEMGLFGIRNDEGFEGRAQFYIRDTEDGARVSVLSWVANWTEMSLVILPDMTGDGAVEVGLKGVFYAGNRPQLFVRNGLTNAKLNTYSFPNLWQSPQYLSFSDVNGDGVNEVALFGHIKGNSKPQVKVIDGTTSQKKLKSYTFPNKWRDTRWLNVRDYNGDGENDWALLGQAYEDSRWQLIIKDGTDPKGALAIYAWPDLDNIMFGRISDYTGDGIAEFALGGFNSAKGRWQLQIKHGQDRNSTLKNITWPDKWQQTSLHVLPDLDSDGIEEVALLGWNNGYQLVIQSSRSDFANSVTINLGDDWESSPSLGFFDGDFDSINDLMIYGVTASEIVTSKVFVDWAAEFNVAPVADAGEDQYVILGSQVYLNGSNSSDEYNDISNYNWFFVSVPEGSSSTLHTDGYEATFEPDVVGEYVIELEVTDSGNLSSSDRITINVRDPSAVQGNAVLSILNRYDQDVHELSSEHEIEAVYSFIKYGIVLDTFKLEAIDSDITIINPMVSAISDDNAIPSFENLESGLKILQGDSITFSTYLPATENTTHISFSFGIYETGQQFNINYKPASAIVRIDPKYPPQAARDGIEGWVMLNYTIDPTGSVQDINVIDAEPKRIFDREARRALAKWKYKPTIINGMGVNNRGNTIMLEFKLD